MDKLFTETEVKKEVSSQNESVVEAEKSADTKSVSDATTVKVAPPQNNSYISSFADMTVADIRKEEEKKKAQEAAEERLRLLEEERIQEQIRAEEERTKEESLQITQEERVNDATENANGTTVIEKPNYDLLESKVIKLKKNTPQKKKRSKKLAGLILACALGGAAIICVTNCVILDQMNSNFLQIEDNYNLKLGKYLRDINNLDATKQSMEMIETYPEDLLDAGDLGQKSNWFDRLCNFIGGLFGG